MSAEPHLALLSVSRWRMRSSAFLQYSLWLDFLPSSWASFLLCPTRPPRHHPERSRRLLSLCAVRYMHLPSMIEKSLDYMSAFWGNWLKFIDLCVFFPVYFSERPSTGRLCSFDELCTQETHCAYCSLAGRVPLHAGLHRAISALLQNCSRPPTSNLQVCHMQQIWWVLYL